MPVEWEVWLADESTLDSSRHAWDDPWDGVLVLRWWKGAQQGICYGDSNYGLYETMKNGVLVPDEVFERVLARAWASAVRPSER